MQLEPGNRRKAWDPLSGRVHQSSAKGMTLIPRRKRFRGSFILRARSVPCIRMKYGRYPNLFPRIVAAIVFATTRATRSRLAEQKRFVLLPAENGARVARRGATVARGIYILYGTRGRRLFRRICTAEFTKSVARPRVIVSWDGELRGNDTRPRLDGRDRDNDDNDIGFNASYGTQPSGRFRCWFRREVPRNLLEHSVLKGIRYSILSARLLLSRRGD